MTSASTWTCFLDSLESELHAVRRVREGRVRPFPELVPPPDLGPLPQELAQRARELVAALDEAQEVVRAELGRTARQLEELRQLDPRGPRPASSFDTRA